jgi:L-amino acid N-acyltransferase YncA
MHIRKAVSADAEELSGLLNELIRAGGTTAIKTPLSAAEFADWFIDGEFATPPSTGKKRRYHFL